MKPRKTYNCPNCGAPINAEKCPYCGTMIWDFSCIAAKEINYIKVKVNGKVYMMRAYLTETSITSRPVFDTMYTDNAPLIVMQRTPEVELDLHFHVVPDENGVLYREVRTDGN